MWSLNTFFHFLDLLINGSGADALGEGCRAALRSVEGSVPFETSARQKCDASCSKSSSTSGSGERLRFWQLGCDLRLKPTAVHFTLSPNTRLSMDAVLHKGFHLNPRGLKTLPFYFSCFSSKKSASFLNFKAFLFSTMYQFLYKYKLKVSHLLLNNRDNRDQIPSNRRRALPYR